MVKGIETFENFFRDFSQEYVLIGGTACDLLMEEAGIEFRATKDLDIVLIVEALTEKFGMKFWEFFRLSALISSDKKLNLNGSILEDMEKFIKRQQRKEGAYGKAKKGNRPETVREPLRPAMHA